MWSSQLEVYRFLFHTVHGAEAKFPDVTEVTEAELKRRCDNLRWMLDNRAPLLIDIRELSSRTHHCIGSLPLKS